MTPMMGGVLVASIGGGRLISKLGRYRIFPIVGTIGMAVGIGLLSQIQERVEASVRQPRARWRRWLAYYRGAVRHLLDAPLTPLRVWQAMEEAKGIEHKA